MKDNIELKEVAVIFIFWIAIFVLAISPFDKI